MVCFYGFRFHRTHPDVFPESWIDNSGRSEKSGFQSTLLLYPNYDVVERQAKYKRKLAQATRKIRKAPPFKLLEALPLVR
jgi:hypothetical protein